MTRDTEQQIGGEELDRVDQRLRLIREKFGYSQRKLAKLSGVSNAAISMIEKGTLNPSVGTMVKLLRAFPVSMAEFWQTEPSSMKKVFFRFEELRKITNNRVQFWQIAADSDPSFLFQYECYEAGADTGLSQMEEECEMVGIVIEGNLRVQVGDHDQIMRAGDVYKFDGRIPHRFRVRGKKPVTMVSCTSPAVF
ncbi:helix-turn-helix domain-containing protein [Pelagibius sp. Alg239-R121]|uniref:helix-turn-helix domain-containing protein n=1 Tax=Pelagibius sp. Alg239-R121 TaxID=2993448 RepID=UPI0024A646EC|nr:helix-turn-helix domain-containing protein [Pelagibius sp. Alg239-R121]